MSFESDCELLDRFFAAITSGDTAAVRDLYAPGAAIWHNFDGKTQTVDENMATLGWVAKRISNYRYEDVRRSPLADGGVLQQHTLRGVALNGTQLAVAACLVVRTDGGKITRVEEYLDTAQVAALAG